MANLASTYMNKGRWDEAEKLQAEELEICKRVLGVDLPRSEATCTRHSIWSHDLQVVLLDVLAKAWLHWRLQCQATSQHSMSPLLRIHPKPCAPLRTRHSTHTIVNTTGHTSPTPVSISSRRYIIGPFKGSSPTIFWLSCSAILLRLVSTRFRLCKGAVSSHRALLVQHLCDGRGTSFFSKVDAVDLLSKF